MVLAKCIHGKHIIEHSSPIAPYSRLSHVPCTRGSDVSGLNHRETICIPSVCRLNLGLCVDCVQRGSNEVPKTVSA